MIRVPIILFTLSIALTTTAQQKPIFRSQTYAGLLSSGSGEGFQVQTINGLGYKNWFGGIGTGIDWGGLRSIPVFLSMNKFLASTKLPLYFSADVGINLPWEPTDLWYIHNPGDYSPGLYWAGGLGWRFGMKNNNNAVLLNFGYNYKRYLNSYETTSPCLVPPCPVDKTVYDYRLRRLSLRVGWMF